MEDFTWRVSRSGYLWGKVDLSATVVHGLITPDTGEGVRSYKPLIDHPELFLEFAKLEPQGHLHLAFAAKYGSLTWDLAVMQRADCRRDWGEFRRDAVKCADPPQGTHATPAKGSRRVPSLADQLALLRRSNLQAVRLQMESERWAAHQKLAREQEAKDAARAAHWERIRKRVCPGLDEDFLPMGAGDLPEDLKAASVASQRLQNPRGASLSPEKSR